MDILAEQREKRHQYYLNTREKRLQYQREYVKNNLDKIRENNKNAYHADKERYRERIDKYYQDNRERICQYLKEYNKTHADKREKWREDNPDRIKEYCKKFHTSDKGKKYRRIYIWKKNGVVCDDYDALYEQYLNTNQCGNCEAEITHGKGLYGRKHLDHDHDTGKFRQILCGICNIHVFRNKNNKD